MAVRPVLVLPHPVLTRVAEPVGSIGESERRLAADLLDTMAASPACVGLAANQIGEAVRACCVDVTGHPKAVSCHGAVVLFDPVLVTARTPVVAREGCMSVPDLTGNVRRASEVLVRGIAPDGAERLIEADAFEARALLHELDHLDGLVFLHRVGSVSSDVFRRVRYR
jgi:peptide deformylase